MHGSHSKRVKPPRALHDDIESDENPAPTGWMTNRSNLRGRPSGPLHLLIPEDREEHQNPQRVLMAYATVQARVRPSGPPTLWIDERPLEA